MRSYSLGIRNANQYARIRHLSSEASVTAHHAADLSSRLLGALQRAHQGRADVALRIPASNREDKDQIVRVDTAALQPVGVGRIPAVVVDPGSEFADIVAWLVGFHPANFAKV